MRREKILNAAYNNKTEGLYVASEIPHNKLNNAKNNYPIPNDETVWVLYDNTIFGHAKHGFVVTDKNIYLRKDWTESGEMFYVPLESIKDCEIEMNENQAIMFDNQFSFNPVSGNRYLIFSFLRNLQNDYSEQLDEWLQKGTIHFKKPEWMKNEEDEFSYNIVIAGKTGVGKSTFINYLFGDSIRETGAGKPVTEKGFFPQKFELNGMKMTLYDSWGLEVGKADEWRKQLDEELQSRSAGSDIRDWFHTVFYCISAGGARVEDFELNILEDFIKDNYTVNIILTKADQATKTEVESIKKAIADAVGSDFNLIPVCSEEKELFGGQTIQPFGRKETEKAIIDGMWDSIPKRLPDSCVEELLEINEYWFASQEDYIREAIQTVSKEELMKDLNERIKAYNEVLNNVIMSRVIVDKLSDAANIYGEISKNLDFESNQFKFDELKQSLEKINDIAYADGTFETALGITKFAGGALFGILAGSLFAWPIALPLAMFGSVFLGDKIDDLFGKKEKAAEKLITQLKKLKEEIEKAILNLNPILKEKLSVLKQDFASEAALELHGSSQEPQNPNTPTVNEFQVGLVLYELGFYKEAESHFKKHIQRNKEDVNARYNLGLCCRYLDKYHEAIDEFLMVITKDPLYNNAFTALGDVYVELEDPEKAINYYQKAYSADKNIGIAEQILRVCLNYGMKPELKRNCISLKKEQPESPVSYWYLCDFYLIDNLFQNALNACSEYLEKDRSNHWMLWKRGQVQIESGHYDEAQDDLLKAAHFSTLYEDTGILANIVYDLARIFFYKGEYQKCILLLNLVADEIDDNDLFELFAYSYLALNMVDEYQKVIEAVKDYDSDTYLSIGRMAQDEFGV